MRIKQATIITVMIPMVALSAATAHITGPDLGQDPPGFTPEAFAPGVISVEGISERSLSISPQGDELFFTRSIGWPNSQTMHMKLQNGVWSTPKIASFLENDWATQAVFSPDGQTLYFSSSRGQSDIRHYCLWRAQKSGDDWLEPELVLDIGEMSIMEYHPSVTRDGSIYFLAWDYPRQTGDIYVTRLVEGQYTDPVMIDSPISTAYNEVRPTIAPDESYLLFESDRPGGYGETDIYISFRNVDGSWSTPKNLGPEVNGSGVDDTPNISPDGHFWFSSINGDIYWRQASAALPIPDGPIGNQTSGLNFGSIQCAIHYAEEGDTLVLQPGIYQESLDLSKNIHLESLDPNNPIYVGGTIIQGNSDAPVLTLTGNTASCVLSGLTLRTGDVGVKGVETQTVMRNCRILDNGTDGLELFEQSHMTLDHCLITANGQTGITMYPGSRRGNPPCNPQIINSVIVQNGAESIMGGEPVIIDCIMQ